MSIIFLNKNYIRAHFEVSPWVQCLVAMALTILRSMLGVFNYSKNINNHTITSAIFDIRDSDGF
jgi:hypothetical protein